MLRDTFLLALIVGCASAIRLQLADTTEDLPDSVTQGPPSGFDDTPCGTKVAPKEFRDPVCFEGNWIEFEWINDTAYWACGKKPETKEYTICNVETGVWEDYTRHDDKEDADVCGAVPGGNKYTVCNHVTHKWQEFHTVNDKDFEVCGLKPAHQGFVVCNHDSEKWEQAGAVHPPGKPICGNRPKSISDSAICDAESGQWVELKPSSKPQQGTCEGMPPKNMTLAICNTETGKWQENYVAIENDTLKSGILDRATEGEVKDTIPMISSDGEVIEVKKDSTKTKDDVKKQLMDSVEGALQTKNKKTKKVVVDDKVVEVVDDKPATKKVVNADNKVVEVVADDKKPAVEKKVTDDGKVVEVVNKKQAPKSATKKVVTDDGEVVEAIVDKPATNTHVDEDGTLVNKVEDKKGPTTETVVLPNKEVVEVEVKDACKGAPPKGAKLATCNTKTGQWEANHVALDKETYKKHVEGKPQTEKKVGADGTITEVVKDEPPMDLAVINGEVIETKKQPKPETEPVVTESGEVVEVPKPEKQKAVTKDGIVVDVPAPKAPVETTKTMITDDNKVVEVPTGVVEKAAPAVDPTVKTETAITADGTAVQVPKEPVKAVPIEAVSELNPQIKEDGTKVAVAVTDDGKQYTTELVGEKTMPLTKPAE